MSTKENAIRQFVALNELDRAITAELAMIEALARFQASDEDPWDSPEWDEDIVALGAPRGHDEAWDDGPDSFGGIEGEDTPLLTIEERNTRFKAWLERTDLID